jgi:hypothetical protein
VKDESWEGPFQLRDYLNRPCGWPEDCLPPEVPGLYVATAETWSGAPPANPPPLCAGKAYAEKSGGLRSRIGDFISSLCGFHGENDTSAGRHAEGIRISKGILPEAWSQPARYLRRLATNASIERPAR